MAYHPGVGVVSLATGAPTSLKKYWTWFDEILVDD